MFTETEREHLRATLVRAAQADPSLSGAAHLGSAAAGCLDRWSDVDLALCLTRGADAAEVLSSWTHRLYREHAAVAHCDVRRGSTLYRVFLLRNTLQVDISFWAAEDFRAVGPKFTLIFGQANKAKPVPAPDVSEFIGMAWLYALHVRSSLARGRLLQAEYMLSGMRDHVLALACVRSGCSAVEGRGFDDLPHEEKNTFSACYPFSLSTAELHRALRATGDALLEEIRHADAELINLIEIPLHEIVGGT
jgi:hypothetical protein